AVESCSAWRTFDRHDAGRTEVARSDRRIEAAMGHRGPAFSQRNRRMTATPQPDWQSDDGSVRLYCGDCLDILPQLPKGCVDAVVTDPPYGINTKSDGNGKLDPWADL